MAHNCRTKACPWQNGFTLLEVLVALSIIAIAFVATVGSTALTTRNIGYLKDKTCAFWVAQNVLARMVVSQGGDVDMPAGNSQGVEILLGNEWYWHTTTESLGLQPIWRIQVWVAPSHNGKSLQHLTTYKSKKQRSSANIRI